jgi:hypothetical protein
LKFFGEEYEEHFFELLQTHQNVVFPMDFNLTEEQVSQFNQIAGDMMKKLGYEESEEYTVDYGKSPKSL